MYLVAVVDYIVGLQLVFIEYIRFFILDFLELLFFKYYSLQRVRLVLYLKQLCSFNFLNSAHALQLGIGEFELKVCVLQNDDENEILL